MPSNRSGEKQMKEIIALGYDFIKLNYSINLLR